jgi:hypothetical protein
MKPPEMTSEFNRLARVRALIAMKPVGKQLTLLVRLKTVPMSHAKAEGKSDFVKNVEVIEKLTGLPDTVGVP